MARIALDAMGGDFAPRATIAGALHALTELDSNHSVQLVGQTDQIESELSNLLKGELSHARHLRDRISTVDAPDTISMSDRPTAALRGKPRNPMAVGIKLQVDGQSDGFVSAGNTGAQMAVSAVMLGLHAGLKRPPVSTILPTSREPIVFLDSGANVDCSPEELVQFAWLGAVYAETVLGHKDPVVGLLHLPGQLGAELVGLLLGEDGLVLVVGDRLLALFQPLADAFDGLSLGVLVRQGNDDGLLHGCS